MTKPLTASTNREKRKELVRLRMEAYRQQLIYNAQPLHNPLGMVHDMIRPKAVMNSAKGPLALGASLFLTLFGKRLGSVGRVARIGLAAYPLINRWRQSQREHAVAHDVRHDR